MNLTKTLDVSNLTDEAIKKLGKYSDAGFPELHTLQESKIAIDILRRVVNRLRATYSDLPTDPVMVGHTSLTRFDLAVAITEIAMEEGVKL